MASARRALVALCALAPWLAGAPAAAHDIWLQPDSFSLPVGGTLVVRQLLGAELETDTATGGQTRELPLLRDMTSRFELLTPAGAVDLLAELPPLRERPSVQPVLERRLDATGPALVTMEHAVLYTEFSGAEFLEYLEHEGLDPAVYREHMGARAVQTEGYQRTMKTLVHVT